LKADLQQEVSNFITKGSQIMTDWANINVQLLTTDRCSNILNKAFVILDGLTSFHIDIIGTPLWPSVEDKYIPLLLFKVYFSGTYIDVKEIVAYLETPLENVLLTGAKIAANTQSDDNTTKLLASFKIGDICMENQTDYTFVSKILLNFDQIMRLTTISIWQKHKEAARQTTAAIISKQK
jgi:hypothetical protein